MSKAFPRKTLITNLFVKGNIRIPGRIEVQGGNIKRITCIEDVKSIVNECGEGELWKGCSPIWARPTYEGNYRVFSEYDVFQVTGHTPIKENYMNGACNILFCDYFSTYQDGVPIGPEQFPVVTHGRQVDLQFADGKERQKLMSA